MIHLKTTASHNLQSRSVVFNFLDFVFVFLCLLIIYSLTYSGSFRVDDEHILVARAQSLAFWDQIQYPQVYGNERVRHLSTVLEKDASPIVAIEPGQAILGSFLYQFASARDLGGIQAYFTLNLYATAITGALVYLSASTLGFRRKTALLTAFLYGLATMAWPYSKTAFRDPLVTVMVALSVLGWVMLIKRSRKVQIVGFFLFLFGMLSALLFKSNVLVLLPTFFISAIVLAYQPEGSHQNDKTWILIGILPLLILGILSVGVSNPGPLSRFSLSYYIESLGRYWESLDSQTLLAVLGPFISPAKSLFLFNPLLLLLPWILVHAWKEMKPITLPTLVGILLLAVFQALHLREHWAGSLVWGLRFMLPILPMLTLLLAPWLERITTNGRPWEKWITYGCIALSALIQFSGAIVAWHVPYVEWYQEGLNPFTPRSIWNFDFFVIPVHVRSLLRIQTWDIAWVRTMGSHSEALLIPLLAILILSWALYLLWKRDMSFRMSRFRHGIMFFLGVLMIGFPIFPSLWVVREDLSLGGGKPELQHALDWAKANVEGGDLVIVDSYGTDLWHQMMNEWDMPIPWYSLPYEIPGASDVEDEPSLSALLLFKELGETYSRLMYLTTQESPDYSLKREEGWLEEHFVLAEEVEFGADTLAKVMVFMP